MAQKGFKKLWKKITGGKEKSAAETIDERLKDHNKSTEDRVRELKLADIINDTIKALDNKTNKLSPEKVQQMGIRAVLNRAHHELVEHPVVTDQDMSEIDECIKYIVYEVARAVEKGYETSAHWAIVALATATETLHVEIKGNDLEYAAELMKKKREYARNLKLLTQNALAYDEYTKEYNNQIRRYQKKNAEKKALTEQVQALIDTKQGIKYLAEIRSKADDPTRLSPEANQLREQLAEMHRMEKEIIAFAIAVNAAAEEQTHYAAEIEQCRNHVAVFPRVTDPKLAAKNKAAADEYAAELRRRLNTAEEGMAAIANTLSELMNLGSHPLFQRKTTDALNMAAELQMRKIREKEDELEAAKAAVRAKEESALLRQIEKNLQTELEKLEEMEELEELEAQTEEIEEQIEATEEFYEEDDEDLLVVDVE